VTGGQLHVAQRDTGVKGGHDERGAQHVGVNVFEPGLSADRLDPAVGGAGIEPSPIVASQDRAGGPLPNREVEGAGGAGHQRDRAGLLPLPTIRSVRCPRSNPRSSTSAPHASLTRSPFNASSTASAAWVGEIRSAVHKKAASSPRTIPPLGGWVDAGAHVLSRVGADSAVDVGEAVVAAHRRQATIDRRGGEPAFVKPRPVQLDVDPGRLQRWNPDGGRPLEELTQIGAIRLEGATPVAGQERHRGQLRLVKHWRIGAHHDRRRRERIEHGHRQPPQQVGGSADTLDSLLRQLAFGDAPVRHRSRLIGATALSAFGAILKPRPGCHQTALGRRPDALTP
jgi:hypothetical protein